MDSELEPITVELAGIGTDKIEVVKAEPFDCESFNCCSGEFGQGSS